MIVWIDPPRGAPATLAVDAREIALRYPGEHDLKIRAGGHVLVFGERVALQPGLVRDLEELDFTVGIGL